MDCGLWNTMNRPSGAAAAKSGGVASFVIARGAPPSPFMIQISNRPDAVDVNTIRPSAVHDTPLVPSRRLRPAVTCVGFDGAAASTTQIVEVFSTCTVASVEPSRDRLTPL